MRKVGSGGSTGEGVERRFVSAVFAPNLAPPPPPPTTNSAEAAAAANYKEELNPEAFQSLDAGSDSDGDSEGNDVWMKMVGWEREREKEGRVVSAVFTPNLAPPPPPPPPPPPVSESALPATTDSAEPAVAANYKEKSDSEALLSLDAGSESDGDSERCDVLMGWEREGGRRVVSADFTPDFSPPPPPPEPETAPPPTTDGIDEGEPEAEVEAVEKDGDKGDMGTPLCLNSSLRPMSFNAWERERETGSSFSVMGEGENGLGWEAAKAAWLYGHDGDEGVEYTASNLVGDESGNGIVRSGVSVDGNGEKFVAGPAVLSDAAEPERNFTTTLALPAPSSCMYSEAASWERERVRKGSTSWPLEVEMEGEGEIDFEGVYMMNLNAVGDKSEKGSVWSVVDGSEEGTGVKKGEDILVSAGPDATSAPTHNPELVSISHSTPVPAGGDTTTSANDEQPPTQPPLHASPPPSPDAAGELEAEIAAGRARPGRLKTRVQFGTARYRDVFGNDDWWSTSVQKRRLGKGYDRERERRAGSSRDSPVEISDTEEESRLEDTEVLSRTLQMESEEEQRLSERECELEVQLASSKALLETFKERLEVVERSVGEMEREDESVGPAIQDARPSSINPAGRPALTPTGSAMTFIKHALSYIFPSTSEPSPTLTTSASSASNHDTDPNQKIQRRDPPISALPSYLFLVGIGMFTVVLRVILRRLMRGATA
jgi:hypothetical protein